MFDTDYDRANVPPYNGNDPPPAPGSLKRSLLPTLLNEVQNKGTQGVRARYGAELPPIISIVRYPGRPVISVPEMWGGGVGDPKPALLSGPRRLCDGIPCWESLSKRTATAILHGRSTAIQMGGMLRNT